MMGGYLDCCFVDIKKMGGNLDGGLCRSFAGLFTEKMPFSLEVRVFLFECFDAVFQVDILAGYQSSFFRGSVCVHVALLER